MRLVALLTWPYLRRHKLRSALTIAGIIIGVALFVAMHTANRTVMAAFQTTVDRIAGKTELQISAGETGFPEDILEKVQSHPYVRAAAPVIEAVVATGIPGQGNLLVLGVDMTGDQSLRDYDLEGGDEDVVEDPLVFLAQPDSIIVSRVFAGRNRLETGSRLPLETMDGARRFTVRGIMRAGGMVSAYGGNLAVMDVYAAQMVFGRGRMFDRIDLALQEGVGIEEGRKSLERLLGPGYQIETPESRGKHFESISTALSFSINITSVFALLIGIFIIYNSFSTAVTQRRGEIGVLRALGATRGQVLGLFLAESAAAGLIGSVLGVVCGRLMARGMTLFMSGLVEVSYGANQRPDELAAEPWLMALAVGLGVVASVLGGLLPARAAARVDPVRALQKGRTQVMTAGENRLRRRLAAAILAAALGLLVFGRGNAPFYVSYILLVVALVLFTPALALRLARMLRPAWKRLRPVEGVLAADSLIQAPRRTSATVAALMLSLAMAVGFAGIASASRGSMNAWMRGTMNFDLILTTSETLSSQSYRFPPEVAGEVASIEGVAEIQPVRFGRIMLRGRPTMMVAVDVESVARRITFQVVEGDVSRMTRLAREGRGAIVSDTLALIEGLKLGDILEIETPSGPLRIPVVGTTVDYTDQRGTILIDRELYRRWWKDDSLNIVRVYLNPGADRNAARERIQERIGARHRLFVLTGAEMRAYVERVADQWLGMTYMQLAVAVLVAILGIINSLTVSILDRRRELGVLQAVGATRAQIRHTIWMEALSIGVIGLILGLAMGTVLLYYDFYLLRLNIVGLRLDYEFPVGFSLSLIPVILGAAFVAALWPAESAVRASLVEALEYE